MNHTEKPYWCTEDLSISPGVLAHPNHGIDISNLVELVTSTGRVCHTSMMDDNIFRSFIHSSTGEQLARRLG